MPVDTRIRCYIADCVASTYTGAAHQISPMLLGIVQHEVVEFISCQVLHANITLMLLCSPIALSAHACCGVKTADVLLYAAPLASMARSASQEEISRFVGHLTLWECTRCLRLSANLALPPCVAHDADCRRTVKTADVLLYVALPASMARIASREEVLGFVGLVM